jgi:hypothetical protein
MKIESGAQGWKPKELARLMSGFMTPTLEIHQAVPPELMFCIGHDFSRAVNRAMDEGFGPGFSSPRSPQPIRARPDFLAAASISPGSGFSTPRILPPAITGLPRRSEH